ncbi:MAG: hypothetical protein TEF_19865 [Rhizobiales bacterium NRL2]|nr:MAG: hypothetical protein TEF_19865 [Rhizobiales bacterium NRL2]
MACPIRDHRRFDEGNAVKSIRPAAVAGAFYPGGREALMQSVDGLLAEAESRMAGPVPVPKAIIAPHAGHVFSGAVAASAYARVAQEPKRFSRVILLGPAHRVAFRGFALPSVDAFDTPLGPVKLDREILDRLAARPDAEIRDDAHAQEHSLEVHLPFLQRVLGDFTLVPVVVGDARPEQVADLLESVWGGDETLIVISTDLSHFHDYDTARRIDGETARKIGLMKAGSFGSEQACGSRPVNGLLLLATRLGLRITELDVRNSGDTAGSRDRVVGYGAWALTPSDGSGFADSHRDLMVTTAARALGVRLARNKRPAVNLETFPHELRTMGASFVTLNLKKRLRGCIGSLRAHRPLAEDIAWNAVSAGFEDPRFEPLTVAEFRDSEIEISVLSAPAPMDFRDEADLAAQLRPGIDGLILQDGERRGTFLPKVWESLDTPGSFLAGLKVKAGLPRNHWSADVKVWRYTTETFGGPVPRSLFTKAA